MKKLRALEDENARETWLPEQITTDTGPELRSADSECGRKQTTAKWTIPLSRSGAIVTSFDSGGDYVAFRMSDNSVVIVNVRKGRSFFLNDLTEKISLVRVSPSGSRILIVQSHSTLVSQTMALEESGSINPSIPPGNCELLHVGYEGSE